MCLSCTVCKIEDITLNYCQLFSHQHIPFAGNLSCMHQHSSVRTTDYQSAQKLEV